MKSLFNHFEVLEDPRDIRGKKHELINIIIMTIYGILCGYTDFTNLADFLKVHEDYFNELLQLENGTPSHDTLSNVFKVIEAWGFKYKTCAFTWVKTRKDGQPLSGMGSYTKANAELCLLAMRGHIKSVDKTVPQIVMHPRQGHSVKPDEVMRRIEKLFGPNTKKIELFARRKVEDWDRWGNEA